MTEDPLDELWELIARTPIKFWACAKTHPREPFRQTVEWTGDVATCLDCGRTNQEGRDR